MTKLYNEHFVVCCTYQNQGPTNILWCVVCTRIRALRTFWCVLYVQESGPYEHFGVCCTYQNQGPTNIFVVCCMHKIRALRTFLWCVVRTRIRALRTFCGVLYVPESGPHEHPGDMEKNYCCRMLAGFGPDAITGSKPWVIYMVKVAAINKSFYDNE